MSTGTKLPDKCQINNLFLTAFYQFIFSSLEINIWFYFEWKKDNPLLILMNKGF